MALLVAAIFKQKCFVAKSLILSFLSFKLCPIFLAYLSQIKSNSPIQGHFCKLEIKSFNLAPRFIGIYQLFLKILALKAMQKKGRGLLR